MKKKVFLMAHFMEIGGVERALLGILHAFDYEKYEVYLFLFRQEGDLFSRIPKEVHLLPELWQYAALAKPLIGVIREKHFLLAASRIFGKCASIFYNIVHHYGKNSQVAIEYSHKFTKWIMPEITPGMTYDLAISFLTPHYFVAEKVKADKKAAWVHTDYSVIQIDSRSESKMWKKYQHIIAVSDQCAASFAHRFPSLKSRIKTIENCLPVHYIREESQKEIPETLKKGSQIILLSIGRFCYAKNFDNIPDICRRILEKGVPVVWYIVGFGTEEEEIRLQIQKTGMQEHVFLLGKKENPYPYIRNCDWYIQPSRFEGHSVTVCEALALHKPVIITAYPTAKSQFRDGYDGMIVPLENEPCAAAIADLIKNDQVKELLIQNTYHREDQNQKKMEKLYALMGENV